MSPGDLASDYRCDYTRPIMRVQKIHRIVKCVLAIGYELKYRDFSHFFRCYR